jgi:L,D-transpeptidase ErfK/SrfK
MLKGNFLNKSLLLIALTLSLNLNNYAFSEPLNSKEKVEIKDDNKNQQDANPYENFELPDPLDIKISPTPSLTPTPSMSISPSPLTSPTQSPVISPTPKVSPTPKATPTPKVSPKPVVIKKDKIELNFSKKVPYVLQPGQTITKTYTVQAHDTLKKIASKVGVKYKYLLSLNEDIKTPLIIGQKIIIDKKVTPFTNYDGVIVNLPERRVYYYEKGELVLTDNVAIGNASPMWQTPEGEYKVRFKVKNPSWSVPISIQNEMKQRGLPVIKEVAAGPNNPLGKWFISIGGGLGLHSTTAPYSIGHVVSHGCIRMRNNSVEKLFGIVKKNTPVKIIYQPVKLSVDENKVFIEVYRDVYYRNINLNKFVKQMLKDYELEKYVDWNKVAKALKSKSETSIEITKNS